MDTLPPVSTIKDVIEIEKTPLEDRLQFNSTYEMIQKGASLDPEAIAIKFLATPDVDADPITMTYAQLMGMITKTANLFHDLGLAHDESVSFMLPNLPQTHGVLWGGEAQGIANPVNPLLEAEHIAGIINAAASKILVALTPMAGSDIWEKVVEIAGNVPTLEAIIVVDPIKAMTGQASTPLDELKAQLPDHLTVLDYADAIQSQPADKLTSNRVFKNTDIASYFHTGGTTGTPKLALHTHMNEIYMAWMSGSGSSLQQGDSIFCGLPLFHVNGVIVTGLSPFARGATVVLGTAAGYRTPGLLQSFWKLTEKYKFVTFSGVPTIYSTLLDVPIDGADISSLEYAVCGAAPMPVELFKRFQEVTNIRIIEGYGLTEGTCASAINPRQGESRIGSIGLRMAYQQIKTVTVDGDGNYLGDCDVNEIGVLAIKGPNVFPGYKQEDKNKDAFVADGWLNTGDLARIDDDGYIWLVGRAKDLIIRGGHNIDPSLIEETLSEHPDVALAAAIGQPDNYAGEVPIAYVTLRDGSNADAETLRQFAKDRIAERAAAPVRVEVLDVMPVTAVGKIFKPTLRQLATEYAYEKALDEADISSKVTVERDTVTGLKAHVKLADSAQNEKAREILGAFPISFEIA